MPPLSADEAVCVLEKCRASDLTVGVTGGKGWTPTRRNVGRLARNADRHADPRSSVPAPRRLISVGLGSVRGSPAVDSSLPNLPLGRLRGRRQQSRRLACGRAPQAPALGRALTCPRVVAGGTARPSAG
jgi:hypothetical protein